MTRPAPTVVGEPAPDFAARNQHGQTVTLADLAGSRSLLFFFPWAFSGICSGELSELRRHAEAYAARRVRVLGLSCDAMFSLRAYAEAERIDFDLLSDHWPHGAIARAYGVFDAEAGCALRGSFFVDESLRVVESVVRPIQTAREIGALPAGWDRVGQRAGA